jgi:hypothetical protein
VRVTAEGATTETARQGRVVSHAAIANKKRLVSRVRDKGGMRIRNNVSRANRAKLVSHAASAVSHALTAKISLLRFRQQKPELTCHQSWSPA